MNYRPKARSHTSGAAGFSLLEILVATTLVGLMLVVLLQILSSTFRVEAGIWKNNQALLIAEKVLQKNCELVSLEAGTYEGQEEEFVYRIRVTPQYEIGETLGDLKILCSLIQVTVFWQERNSKKSLVLETVRTAAQKKN
ncbi:MAG TPA: hypothetical protein DCY27_14045 [Desulfobacterales bacterium]|nr:hypothetical protein [Desulfobacterales bacterium]